MLSIKCLLVTAVVSLVRAQDAEDQSARSGGGRGLFLNHKTSKFAVKGNQLPEVNFNIGESYAGSLPIVPLSTSSSTNQNSLWFWFFPSTNPAAKKEIVIWLSGGPGCSGLSGVLQESGPFIWQPGTYEPNASPYSWNKLTNVIYIDQPIGTGFSKGSLTIVNETDVANHFMGFWKNFVNTFSIQGYKIYFTGESFPVVPALLKYKSVLGLDDSIVADFKAQADSCGYTSYHAQHTTAFPPTGPIPALTITDECKIWGAVVQKALFANPCFNVFHLTDYCPYLWSELGFPGFGGGPNNYFNRVDVQRAIHAPKTNFWVCEQKANIFEGKADGDKSLPAGLGPLPSVIDRTNNVIISHGLLDFLLFADGSLITIQNMTWGGLQGFRTRPSSTLNFFAPFQSSIQTIAGLLNNPIPYPPPQYNTAAYGYQGVSHTERGLTYVTVNLAGHQQAQYTPGAAYRQLEFLLGRISSLQDQGPYTTG